MSWINLKLDVQIEDISVLGKADVARTVRKGIIRELDLKNIAAPDRVRVSVDFTDKDQLFYMITDLGKEALVTLFYEEYGDMEETGHEFKMHSYMIGTEQGCGYIDYEIKLILERENEEGLYYDGWSQVYLKFQDLPPHIQEEITKCIDDDMSLDERIIALNKIGIAADVNSSGALQFFRFK